MDIWGDVIKISISVFGFWVKLNEEQPLMIQDLAPRETQPKAEAMILHLCEFVIGATGQTVVV